MSSAQNLRQNITQRMDDLELNQNELARLLGCSRSYVSQLRNREDYSPGLEVIDRLADALKTTADALIAAPEPVRKRQRRRVPA